MPWKIKDDGEEFLVITSDGKKIMGRHRSRGKARRQLAALYANEPSAAKKGGTFYSTLLKTITTRTEELKGGAGSGNHGHRGIIGKRGGSSSGSGYLSDRTTSEVKLGGGQSIYVDEAISNLVKDMNKNGLETTHSCSGHQCERPLESQIGYRINPNKKGDKTHEKLVEIVDSGKLGLDWTLVQNPNDEKMFSLHPATGHYGTANLLSDEKTVKQAVLDFNTIRNVIKKQ